MSLPGFKNSIAVFVEGIAGGLVCIGQQIHQQPGAESLIVQFGQLGVDLVLTQPDPIQGIRQGSGNLSGLGRFIGRFNQRFNWDGFSKGAIDACGNVDPLCHVLSACGKLGQKLGRLCGLPRISENRVKALIGLPRRVRSESRGLKRGIQQGHGFPVLLRGFVQIPDGLSGLKRNIQQLGHCAAHKVGNDPVRQGKAIVHPVCGIAHIVQTVRGVLCGVIHIVQPLLKIPEFLLREGRPGPRQIQLQIEIIQLALTERAVEMIRSILHLRQPIRREGGLLRQKPLLLGKQLCIGGVQF